MTPSGARSWILRCVVGDKRRHIGLGGYPEITLAQSREHAREARNLIRQGVDPVADKRERRAKLVAQQRKGLTFRQAVDRYLDAKLAEFNNLKHQKQWRSTLENYAVPALGDRLVSDINVMDIQQILEPIWTVKTETASRVRGRVEAVLAWATVSGHREGDKALQKLVKALLLAKVAVEEVSPWIETGLETIMHKCIMSLSWKSPTEIPVPPHNKKNFHKAVDYWIAAAEEAELMRQSGRPDHGKNWRAIALIDEARKVWTSITGKDAPAKALNEDTRFGRFIAGSLKSVEKYADARNAYEAWADIAHEEGSLLETPK